MNNKKILLSESIAPSAEVPFTVYFINSSGSIYPRRMYTVVRVRNGRYGQIECFIAEWNKYIQYKSKFMSRVSLYFPN